MIKRVIDLARGERVLVNGKPHHVSTKLDDKLFLREPAKICHCHTLRYKDGDTFKLIEVV